MSVIQLMRSDLQNLTTYRSQPITNQHGKLSATETPWDPLPDFGWQLNRYPQRQDTSLCAFLCQQYDVDPMNLLLTRGSDDGIDAITRLFITPFEDAAIICPPTFIMYQFSTRLQGGDIIECPLQGDDFSLRQAVISDAIHSPKSKILFICRPNNPTGNTIALDTVARLCQLATNQAMVVVDEAYIEFSSQASASQLINQYDNLIVLRTLSKAYAMAGLRLGVILANATVIERIGAVLPPYPLPTPVIELAKQALKNINQINEQIDYIRQQRQWLIDRLARLPAVKKVWPSDGNFVLVLVVDSSSLVQYLAERGLMIREISPTLVRMSVGTASQNQALIDALWGYR